MSLLKWTKLEKAVTKTDDLWEGVNPWRMPRHQSDGSRTGGPVVHVRKIGGRWRWELLPLLNPRPPYGEADTRAEAMRAAEEAFPTKEEWEAAWQQHQNQNQEVD
jgi:hypothetical protein